MNITTQSVWSWQFLKWYLRIWIPVVLALGTGLWLLYHFELDANMESARASERHVIEQANAAIRSELASMQSDALYLAEHASLQQLLSNGQEGARKQFAKDMLSFARHRGLYDHIRFLDMEGGEVVRVNWQGGRPRQAADLNLQNKSNRYYVRDTLSLKQRAVYISPFDLNIENNEIEQPIKPMIRIGTPVFDRQGRKRGLIVLNYLAERLLKKLRLIRSQYGGDLWLLNEKGYWLLGPHTNDEWGFMFPERKDRRFDNQFAPIWSALQTQEKSLQTLQDGELFTATHIVPGDGFKSRHAEQWIMVAHLSRSVLAERMSDRSLFIIIEFIVLTLLPAVVIAAMTYYILKQKTEPRIRESEARFSNLFESAPDAMVIVDRLGNINLINSMAEKIFGYKRDELLGEPVEKLIPNHIREQHIVERSTYVASKPKSRVMAANIELYGLHKDGSIFPVEINLSPSESSKGMQITSIIRDVSARKQTEREKQLVEARFGELVNNLPVGVYRYTMEDDGRFLEVNPAMLEIFDAESSGQLLSHAISELHCDMQSHQQFNNKLTMQGALHNEEVNMKTLKGREFVAAVTAVVKQDIKGNTYIDGIVEDISERKRDELQIQKLNDSLRTRSTDLEAINRELEAFSYSVSHDLRAPLRAIDGFSRTLLTGYADKLDETGQDRLDRIRAAAQRMGKLIDDLLNLSRVSRIKLEREKVDVSQIADEVAQELSHGEPERKVSFSIQPELSSQADSRLLRVVMDNLIGNAWKFTARQDDANIEVGQKLNGEGHVFYVRDNGAGFDMRYADKLFGAFQRLHDNSEFPGTGIGLATVQRVINKHGGRIWAESEIGKGTSFYFTLEHGEMT